jgi:predicted Zn-dependent protease
MLAGALLTGERYGEAAAQYEEAARIAPDNPRVADGLGRSYEALAANEFQSLEKAAPQSPELPALAGDFEAGRGQLARAFERYRQALAIEPAFRGLHAAIATIYEKTGRLDWAVAERAQETLTPPDCEAQVLECDFAAGRLREVASAPAADAHAMYWRAKAFRELSRKAYEWLDELPPSTEKYEAAASAHEKSGRYPEAATAWREALKLQPKDARLQRQLALALCHSNDCVSALSLVKDLLAREPASAELNYLYGTALSSTQEAGQALRYLETAVKLDGSLLPARAALGQAYLEAGEPLRAVAQLETAVAEDEDGSRHYQLARAYQATGQEERAAAVLKTYREILRRREAAEKDEPRITPP